MNWVECIGVLVLLVGVFKLDELNRTIGGVSSTLKHVLHHLEKHDQALEELDRKVDKHGEKLAVLTSS